MAIFRRGPKLLPASELPEGFTYPDGFAELVAGRRWRHWEFLEDHRLRQASSKFWQHHPRHLVPIAVRRETNFLLCLDTSAPDLDGSGYDVVTVDALDADAAPVQHLPDLDAWIEAARAEEDAAAAPPPPPPPPPERQPGEPLPPPPEPVFDDLSADPLDAPREGGWTPPERGACACIHHLDAFAAEVVPYAASAPNGLPPARVADLVARNDLEVAPERVQTNIGRGRMAAAVEFTWKARLGTGALLHVDEGRASLPQWLMFNPGVGLVFQDGDEFRLQAPGLCRDGVLTLFARMLLDDRVRRRR